MIRVVVVDDEALVRSGSDPDAHRKCTVYTCQAIHVACR